MQPGLPETFPHLRLVRTESIADRRRHGGGRPPTRGNPREHGEHLSASVANIVRQFELPHLPPEIDPALIFRIHLDGYVDDAEWRRSGLIVLSREKDRNLVLFSDDAQLTEFRNRLSAYQSDPPLGQVHPSFNALFASISDDGLRSLAPEDRIGARLREQGIQPDETYILDLELWPLPRRGVRRSEQILDYIRSQGALVLDSVDNDSMIIHRIECRGELASALLGFEAVARLDLPPEPALSVSEVLDITAADLPDVLRPTGNSSICILDSGISSGHPLLGPVVGDADVFPASLGTPDDSNGHGTMVAGIAAFGDISASIASRAFDSYVTLFSARVTDETNRFAERTLVLNQMRQAIETFAARGCKVFNVSLGNRDATYDDGRLEPWAAVLDTLARELDVLIVVSAGNRMPIPDVPPGDARMRYPQYLFDQEARIIDPATAALVVTVGALSGPGAPVRGQRYQADPAYQRITRPGQPSPFTRVGPGQQQSIKPDFCEFGGDFSYDGRAHRVVESDQGVSVVSLNYQPFDRLFSFGTGTSFAAPRVAHYAARLFDEIPEASPNLVRALLALSAEVPSAALEVVGARDILNVCGYGKPEFDRARASTLNRVVLHAVDDLRLDSFHVFELPIPDELIRTKGQRRISIALAFYPPVRHTRLDYLGARMSFRLVRGKSLDEVIAAYQAHGNEEGEPPTLTGTRFQCALTPGARNRDTSTLQKGEFTFTRNPDEYGDTYYIVVRAERVWAPEDISHLEYAIAASIEHRTSPIESLCRRSATCPTKGARYRLALLLGQA